MQNTLTANKTTHSFNANDLIPLRPSVLWLLEWGVVRSITWNEEGTLITLGYWGIGDLIGQPLSVAKEPHQVKCLTRVEACCIASKDWYWFSEHICHQAQQSQELLAIVRIEKIKKRLKRFLLWLANKFGRRVENGQLIDLRLTHQELAEAIGASRVTVTRLLNEFERQGVISRPRRNFIVLA